MIQTALLHAPESHAPVAPVSDWTPPGCLRVGKQWRHAGPLELRIGPPTNIGRPRKVPTSLCAIQCVGCGRSAGGRLQIERLHPRLVERLRFWSGEQLSLISGDCMTTVSEGTSRAARVVEVGRQPC